MRYNQKIGDAFMKRTVSSISWLISTFLIIGLVTWIFQFNQRIIPDRSEVEENGVTKTETPSVEIKGIVFDGPACKPVAYANVFFSQAFKLIKFRSDKDGKYHVNLAPGRYQVSASNPNFQNTTVLSDVIDIEPGSSAIRNIFLTSSPSPLPKSGLNGMAYEQTPATRDDGLVIRKGIEGVQLTFRKANSLTGAHTITRRAGFFKINLSPDVYSIASKHAEYMDYPGPGTECEVPREGYKTCNIRLIKKPQPRTSGE